MKLGKYNPSAVNAALMSAGLPASSIGAGRGSLSPTSRHAVVQQTLQLPRGQF
jgi:hypothetical protein